MTYAVSILRRAQKELQQLPREDYERTVHDKIRLGIADRHGILVL